MSAPGLTRMAIMESNAAWLPMLLEECDRAVHLYKNQRNLEVKRLMHGIEPRLYTTREPESYRRPDWYPKLEDVEHAFAHLVGHA